MRTLTLDTRGNVEPQSRLIRVSFLTQSQRSQPSSALTSGVTSAPGIALSAGTSTTASTASPSAWTVPQASPSLRPPTAASGLTSPPTVTPPVRLRVYKIVHRVRREAWDGWSAGRPGSTLLLAR